MGSSERKPPPARRGGQPNRGQASVQLILVGALLALLVAGSARAAPRAFSPSRLKHIRANGISIGYRAIGAGPPLVMIMGYSGTLYVWDPGLLGRLARHHRDRV